MFFFTQSPTIGCSKRFAAPQSFVFLKLSFAFILFLVRFLPSETFLPVWSIYMYCLHLMLLVHVHVEGMPPELPQVDTNNSGYPLSQITRQPLWLKLYTITILLDNIQQAVLANLLHKILFGQYKAFVQQLAWLNDFNIFQPNMYF